jgi:hypothetical protein
MNIKKVEKKIIKSIRKQNKEVSEETSFETLETIEHRFIDLENVVKELFLKYRG